MQFTDRVFLANYSVDSIAAALPAGIASFTLISFFMAPPTTRTSLSRSTPGPRF